MPSWTFPIFLLAIWIICASWTPMWDAIEEHNRRAARKRHSSQDRAAT